jgi:hypothetical protein
MPGWLASMCRAVVAVDRAARPAAIRGWAVNGHEDPGRQQSQQTPPGEPDPAAAGLKDSTILFRFGHLVKWRGGQPGRQA